MDEALARELERLHSALGEVKALTGTASTHILQLAERIGGQNHRLDKVEFEIEKAKLLETARQEWHKANSIQLRWFITAGLAGAGVLSAVVFEVLNRI